MTIDDFVSRYFSLSQTALVDNMIYEDKHMELFNNFYNIDLYRIKLSSGTFTGTHGQLMTKKASLLKVLQQGSSDVLQHDIELLETTRGTERTVYEWYAIPYWIARHMIDSDEVVLSWKDCYWWGRSRVGQSLISDPGITTLFNDTKA